MLSLLTFLQNIIVLNEILLFLTSEASIWITKMELLFVKIYLTSPQDSALL